MHPQTFHTHLTQWHDAYADMLSAEQWVNKTHELARPHFPENIDDNTLKSILLGAHENVPSDRDLATQMQPLIESADHIRVIAYRGELGEAQPNNALHTRRASISFGSKAVAMAYAANSNDNDSPVAPRVIEAEILIKKPVFNDAEDPFIDAEHLINIVGRERTMEILRENAGHLTNTDNWDVQLEEYDLEYCGAEEALTAMEKIPGAIESLYLDAYPVLDNDKYVGWFKEMGYDGCVHGGNGESALEAEYKIFHPEQANIRNIDWGRPTPAQMQEHRPRITR